MAEWINIASFVADEIITAARFRQIVDNLNTLKNPQHTLNKDDAPSTSIQTTSTTLVDTDDALYTLSIDTEGGDVLVFLGTNFLHSVVAGRIGVALRVDGVLTTATNADDVHQSISTTERLMYNCAFLLENLAAGSHEIELAWHVLDAGTGTLRKYRHSYFFAVELI